MRPKGPRAQLVKYRFEFEVYRVLRFVLAGIPIGHMDL